MTVHSQHIPCTGKHLDEFGRVKVDIAQTGFFKGKEYRTFKELSIASMATYVIRAVVPKNMILHSLELSIDEGAVKLSTVLGGTAGGTFSETLPVFNRNNMTVGTDREAIIPATLELTGGGTHTGGTVLDVARARTSGMLTRATSVGSESSDERGIAPNTYYFRFENIAVGTCTGVFKLRWEER